MPDIFKLRCVASPVLTTEGLIIAQCGQGQAASEIQAIKGAAENKPAKAYEIVRTGGYVPTPIAVGDLLFLWKENGTVTCVRSSDGEQIWSERAEGPYYASPICIGGKGGRLYNITRAGELVVIGATDKFKLIQRFPLGEKNSYATPAVSGGRLYVRTYTQLISIGK
jgi:outer membrane protein assembly factor BamB